MKFDRFDEVASAPALLPDGTHDCEITKVKDVERKDGSSAIVLTLAATTGDFNPVERWLDPSEKRDHALAMQLLAALGLPKTYDIDSSLVGRRVMVTTKVGIKKTTGLPTVYVNAFAAAEAAYESDAANARPAAKPAARSQAAKAHQAFTANAEADDIPF